MLCEQQLGKAWRGAHLANEATLFPRQGQSSCFLKCVYHLTQGDVLDRHILTDMQAERSCGRLSNQEAETWRERDTVDMGGSQRMPRLWKMAAFLVHCTSVPSHNTLVGLRKQISREACMPLHMHSVTRVQGWASAPAAMSTPAVAGYQQPQNAPRILDYHLPFAKCPKDDNTRI